MADRNKAKLVNGFVTLRATQRHSLEKRYSTKDSDETEKKPTSSPQAGAKSPTSGIGRTVMPTQHEIVCYSCAFRFTMRGKAASTQCPKCGARLGLNDETITGAFSDELITAGKVRLTKTSIVDGGRIVANDVIVEGIVKGGTIKAYKTLELGSGAVMSEDIVDAHNLRIAEGASFDFRKAKTFHDVEIHGELKADLKVTGTITISATGHLLGSVRTAHLIVEEGAGLNADVRVRPESDTDDAEDAHVSGEPAKVKLPE